MAIEIALVGASGRMGSRIDALAADASDLRIAMRVGRASTETDDARIDVVIDFSSEAGTAQAMALARSRRAALLVGTTGLSEATRAALFELSRSIPVLVAPNTSLGVAVTRRLARIAAEILGPAGWKVDIVESHHDRKKDAPSGTALAIAAAIAEGGMAVTPDRIHAIRAGDTVGEHEIRLAGPSERIHLMHQAVTRDLFAEGALRAARWLAGRAPGSYSMDDVLAAHA
jgi:4-hydroxy-tetrahydrodipicolinate reductase